MPNLHLSARHIKQTDTRKIVGRRFKYENLASLLLFPPDPSQFTSDLVWKEDQAGLMRRLPGLTGIDGQYPLVSFRTAGTMEWNIPLYTWMVRQGMIEEKTSDPVLKVRERSLKWAHFKARIEREIRAWNTIRDTGIFTQGITLGAGSRLDDISSSASDPVAVFQLGAEKIKRNSGEKCNLLLVPEPIHRKMTQHERLMSYAVNKLNLSKDRPIDGEVIEQLIGYDRIEKGSYKVVDAVFNNTPDSSYLTEQRTLVYPTGPTVIMAATGTPGGVDGDDNSVGFGKYLEFLKGSFDDSYIQIAAGNEGIAVFDFPDTDLPGGGTKTQLVDAWAPFVQNPQAAYLISTAADSTNTAEYESSLSF